MSKEAETEDSAKHWSRKLKITKTRIKAEANTAHWTSVALSEYHTPRNFCTRIVQKDGSEAETEDTRRGNIKQPLAMTGAFPYSTLGGSWP